MVVSCDDIAIISVRDLLKLAIVAQLKMTIGFRKDQSHPTRRRGKTLFLRSNHSKSHNRDQDALKGGGDVVIESPELS